MVARGYASLSFLHEAAEYISTLEVPAYIYDVRFETAQHERAGFLPWLALN